MIKQLLIGLLGIGCLFFVIALVVHQPVERSSLEELSEVDEIINRNLSDLRELVVSSRETQVVVDSLFTRKDHRLTVQSGFPSTAYHIRLAEELRRKGLNISGKRTFPSRELILYITYENTLVRKITIQYQ